jgi:hypothetical protein
VISKGLFLKLFLLLLVCSIVVLSISAPTFATANDSIELESSDNVEDSISVFPEISGYDLKPLYRDTEYEKLSTQDASFVYCYFPSNASEQAVYVVVGVSGSISTLHSWEVCFVTYQTAQGQYPIVDVYDSREIHLLQDPPLVAKFFVFDSPENYTQTTLYWYTKATFKAGLTVQQKYVRISLIILTQDSEGYSKFEEDLLAIGQEIANTWEPLQTQSLISLGVPAQQASLAISVAFLGVTLTTQYISEKRKASNNLKLFSNFASAEEKLVLQTMHDLADEKNNITTNDVLEKLRAKGGKRSKMSFKKLLGILNVLAEYGLIRRAVISTGNSPVLVWEV